VSSVVLGLKERSYINDLTPEHKQTLIRLIGLSDAERNTDPDWTSLPEYGKTIVAKLTGKTPEIINKMLEILPPLVAPLPTEPPLRRRKRISCRKHRAFSRKTRKH
jgi:hypothetical protein